MNDFDNYVMIRKDEEPYMPYFENIRLRNNSTKYGNSQKVIKKRRKKNKNKKTHRNN